MAARCHEPITLSDLVAVCGVSRSGLHAAFKAHCGYTPMQFLADRRLALARERVLHELQTTVTQIAMECGFSNHGRFAMAYRRRFGEAPSETLSRAVKQL